MKNILLIFAVITFLMFTTGCTNNPKINLNPNNNVITNLSDCLNDQKFVPQECKCDPGYRCDCAIQISACEFLARNTTNTETLSLLSDTQDIPTLLGVINNNDTTREILTHIYYRTDMSENYIINASRLQANDVKEAIASNLKTDPVVLAELGNYFVVNHTVFLALSNEWVKDGDHSRLTEESASYVKNITDKIYIQDRILERIAANPNSPIETLQHLVNYSPYTGIAPHNDSLIIQLTLKNLESRLVE